MAAPRWSPAPQAWEEAGSAAQRGAAWRGEPLRDEAKQTGGGTKRSETRRKEAKSSETRRRPHGGRARYARDVRAPTRSALLRSAQLGSTSRHVCVHASCACDDGALVLACTRSLARSRALTHASVVRARQSRSTRAKGIDGAAAKPPEPLFHIGATSNETLLYDRRGCGVSSTRTHPLSHIYTCDRFEREREREREREERRGGTSGTNERRESKRVRTMCTRYGSMTYYE